jgi:hypothetical protein
MARKTNYSFEKRQRELRKTEKKAAKAEAKKAARGDLEPGAETPDTDTAEIGGDAPVQDDTVE